ncbi:MAG: hypothetical protein QNL95_06310 [OM182 bacterium]
MSVTIFPWLGCDWAEVEDALLSQPLASSEVQTVAMVKNLHAVSGLFIGKIGIFVECIILPNQGIERGKLG